MTEEKCLVMTKEECLIRRIIGPSRRRADAFACAIRVTYRLIFEQGRSLNDIMVSKDVYPVAARLTGQSPAAASRQIERLANLCWDNMDERQKDQLIGRRLDDICSPRDILFYFAFFCRYNKPFFVLCENDQTLLTGAERPL